MQQHPDGKGQGDIGYRGYAGYGAVNAPIRLAAQARHKPDFPD